MTRPARTTTWTVSPTRRQGHRVAVGVEIDRGVGPDLADQVAWLAQRSAAAEGAKGAGLVGEANQRQLARGPLHAHVGDLAVSLLEVRDEGAPAGEAAAGNGVALHISDAALVLTLGACSVWRAGSWREAQ